MGLRYSRLGLTSPGWAAKKGRRAMNKLYTSLVRRAFRSLRSFISWDVEFTNPQFITIGESVHLRPFVWLYAIVTGAPDGGDFAPSLEIGDRCSIGRFCHFTCSNRLVLEPDVLVGEGVLISDSSHAYRDISTPILRQPVISSGPLVIGAGTWIGNGARVLGKVRVGRNCVIGAGAHVTRDLPDYSVAVGSPARVVLQYDPAAGEWRRRGAEPGAG